MRSERAEYRIAGGIFSGYRFALRQKFVSCAVKTGIGHYGLHNTERTDRTSCGEHALSVRFCQSRRGGGRKPRLPGDAGCDGNSGRSGGRKLRSKRFRHKFRNGRQHPHGQYGSIPPPPLRPRYRAGTPPGIRVSDQSVPRGRQSGPAADRPVAGRPPALLVPLPARIASRPDIRRRLSGSRVLLLQFRKPGGAGQPRRVVYFPRGAHRADKPAAVVQLRMEFRTVVRLETLRRADEPGQHNDGVEDKRLHQRRFLPQRDAHARAGFLGGTLDDPLLERQHQISQCGTQLDRHEVRPALLFRPGR